MVSIEDISKAFGKDVSEKITQFDIQTLRKVFSELGARSIDTTTNTIVRSGVGFIVTSNNPESEIYFITSKLNLIVTRRTYIGKLDGKEGKYPIWTYDREQ